VLEDKAEKKDLEIMQLSYFLGEGESVLISKNI
jgi:hypothetical protein